MSNLFLLEIVTPERQVYNGPVEQIICQCENGQIGVLKGHIPMITTLAEGDLKIKEDGGWKTLFIYDGFMEVTGDKATIFTQNIE